MYASQSWVKELVTRLFKKNNEYMLSKTCNYSLEEQVIGTWVDGKPLYRKIIINCGTLPNNTDKTISINLDNPENIITCKGIAHYNNSEFLTLPYFYSTESKITLYINNNGQNLLLFTKGNFEAYEIQDIIIEYTKTTD